MQILFGQSETPTRIVVGIQSTDAFTGLFNKSAFAFDRWWAKASTVTSSFEAPVTFQEPQIPPHTGLHALHDISFLTFVALGSTRVSN